MPNFVCQNSDYYSPHGTGEIKVHKLKKTNKSPHLKQKGRGELGKDLLFTEAGPGGSDGSGQSASLSPAWWLILVRVFPGCWKCVFVWGWIGVVAGN